ncbi:nucleotidyltransferase domain-containing protein [Micromonospora sp. CA-111912]|uniref:nucleotidyltransferase domain-containing protein n=1 Tax=Micromonospora sp. CA-111912 TaxID=3239955 RepID=UPI003D8FF4E2
MVGVGELPALTVAELLADSFADIVGAAARSVILHGSLPTGGFHSGRSDIDLLAVIDGGLADAQVAALERLVRQADMGSAAGIDVHVVTSEVATAPACSPGHRRT